MVLPQLPSYSNAGSSQDGVASGQQVNLDSITLGQLRAMVGSAPKPKARRVYYHGYSVSSRAIEKVAILLRLSLRR